MTSNQIGLLAAADSAWRELSLLPSGPWHARRTLLAELSGLTAAIQLELDALDVPAWVAEQLTTRIARRVGAHMTTHIAQEAPMGINRKWLNHELSDAILSKDLDRLQDLADYAVDNDDQGTAADIEGRIIKSHSQKWSA